MMQTLSALRKTMEDRGITAYILTCYDFHINVCVNGYFRAIRQLTGFTGNDGTLVVTATTAHLFVDPQYDIQARRETEGTGVVLSMDEQLHPFIKSLLRPESVLGFDGRCISTVQGQAWRNLAKVAGAKVRCLDLMEQAWPARPRHQSTTVFELPLQYSGESATKKISRVWAAVVASGADCHLTTASENLCWLLNLRGSDLEYMHLAQCFGLMDKDALWLFIDTSKINASLAAKLNSLLVTLLPYEALGEYLPKLTKGKCVFFDPTRVSDKIAGHLADASGVIYGTDPHGRMKQKKNQVELYNFSLAQEKDSVAVTQLIHWLKTSPEPKTEVSVVEKLEQFRQLQPNYMDASAAPICAYGVNGAEVYHPPVDTVQLGHSGFLVLDVGSNYCNGSTDIARTIALGALCGEMRQQYTLILEALLDITHTHFPYGVRGCHLDAIVRSKLWNLDMDTPAHTGHSLGYMLNAYEPPIDFQWRVVSQEASVIEPGMMLSVEPSLYVEGAYGIRLENNLVVQESQTNVFGRFMEMAPYTYVPFDLDAIDHATLSPKTRDRLNAYHEEVYRRIAPHLDNDARMWLLDATRKV